MHFSVASSTIAFTSPTILSICASPMPNCFKPLAVDLDRVALLPAVELALGAILGGVGARVAAVAVGQALDQRRAAARARLVERLQRLAVDHVGVVAVDHDLRQAVGGGAVAGRARHRGHVADRRVFHVEVVLADEHHRQLPHRGEVQRLVERADVGGAVAEEADRHVLVALVLRPPGRAAGDRQVRADDGVGAHHAVLLGGEVHRAALAAHQPVVALHQLAQHLLDRHAAGQRVGMAAIGAERKIALLHGDGEARGHRLLPERQVAGALHQVLQKQVVGALLGLADDDLALEQLEPGLLADVVVYGGFGGGFVQHCAVPRMFLSAFFGTAQGLAGIRRGGAILSTGLGSGQRWLASLRTCGLRSRCRR